MIIRAIFCATSDLAAMSAIPYCIFLSLTIPNKKGKNSLKVFLMVLKKPSVL